MERPSRSLRKLPVRAERRSKSGGRASSTNKSPKKSPARKPAVKDKTSPPRRSRSRSAGRKKIVVQNTFEEKKVTETIKNAISTKKKSATPPRTAILSRLKESVEKARKSLSPDIEEMVRRSVSRFEEVKADVVRSMTPITSSISVTQRSSLRLRSAENKNSVTSVQDSEKEYIEEKTVKNHVGANKEKDHYKKLATGVDGAAVLRVVLLLICLAVMSTLTLAGHLLCSKGDCRLLVDEGLQKAQNYKRYFDSFVWPGFSGFTLLLYVTSRFVNTRVKKFPLFSILGLGWLVVALGSLGTCHYYFGGLHHLKILPFLTATLFHVLIILALSGTSQTFFSVKLQPLFYKLFGLITLVIQAWFAASETYKTFPNIAVYLLAGLQAFFALDSLVFDPLPSTTTPVLLLSLALRPFMFILPQVYITANNVKVSTPVLAIITALFALGYLLYRGSILTKAPHVSDSYSHNIRLSVYGDYSGGVWKWVRHPDLVGRMLIEFSCAVGAVPNPISYALVLYTLMSTVLEARHLDHKSHSSHSRGARFSVIPFVY